MCETHTTKTLLENVRFWEPTDNHQEPKACDLWDIWSEWLGDMTWPKNTYLHTYPPTYLPTYVPPLENTLKERSKRLVTFETFDQSDEKTWPDQKIPTYLHTYPLTYLPTYLCTSIREQPIGAIIGTCDIWDTDYNTDNWEPGFMTIIVTWQLIVTLDSIRNSCDV